MPVQMDPVQLAFWRELLAPFRDDELSEVPARGGKKILKYIDKRALENRLDSVCGPHGWYPEYEATARGYKCRLYIEVPLRQGWGWMHKEDGAGFEEMGSKNRETGEWEADVDNDEKSGYTNALRRAAQDAWGIGRYLYNKGIPTFLDPGAVATEPRRETAGMSHTLQRLTQQGDALDFSRPPKEITQRPRDATAIKETPVSAPTPKQVDPAIFRLPMPGRAWGWSKDMEKIFETQLSKGMTEEALRLGFSNQFNSWDEAQTKAVCMSAIRHIATLRSYAGQFADLLAKDDGPTAAPKPAGSGVNIADFRKEIVVKLKALIAAQTGREATDADAGIMFREIAPQCKTASGHAGEVPESLRTTTDPVWLSNIILFIDQQIEHVAKATPAAAEVADIPF